MAALVAVTPALGCRWAIYASADHALPAATLLTDSSHSLAAQSHGDRLLPGIENGKFYDVGKLFVRNHRTHQDGWGVGWFEDDWARPRRKRSAAGVTAPGTFHLDPQVTEVTAESKVMFAHIRAATDGDLADVNSHPFQFNRLLWMHNGGVPDREALEALVSGRCTDVARVAHGATDSELVGALVAELLGGACHRDTFSMAELREAFVTAVQLVDEEAQAAGSHASLNLALTDGRHVLVTRYRTKRDEDPPSLYFAAGDAWDARGERMTGKEPAFTAAGKAHARALMVASEPLAMAHEGWHTLLKDELLTFDLETGQIERACLTAACQADFEHRTSRAAGVGVTTWSADSPPPLLLSKVASAEAALAEGGWLTAGLGGSCALALLTAAARQRAQQRPRVSRRP